MRTSNEWRGSADTFCFDLTLSCEASQKHWYLIHNHNVNVNPMKVNNLGLYISFKTGKLT